MPLPECTAAIVMEAFPDLPMKRATTYATMAQEDACDLTPRIKKAIVAKYIAHFPDAAADLAPAPAGCRRHADIEKWPLDALEKLPVGDPMGPPANTPEALEVYQAALDAANAAPPSKSPHYLEQWLPPREIGDKCPSGERGFIYVKYWRRNTSRDPKNPVYELDMWDQTPAPMVSCEEREQS